MKFVKENFLCGFDNKMLYNEVSYRSIRAKRSKSVLKHSRMTEVNVMGYINGRRNGRRCNTH